MAASPLKIFSKDPSAILDYSFNWRRWLKADRILTSTWVVPGGITKDSDTFAGTISTIWLSGGTDGTTYIIVNRITTVGGRTQDRTFHVQVREG